MTGTPTLVLVANPEAIHVGAHLQNAARVLGIETHVCDVREAFDAQWWRQKLDWWMRGHRPSRLREFSSQVAQTVERVRPDWVLTTGLAPVDAAALDRIGARDTARLNFLTDDPWNPMHHASWFLDALRSYDEVFSPRHANLGDLEALQGPRAAWLPFAYAPEVHFPDPPRTDDERRRYDADVMFAGGADPDRVAVLSEFVRAGLNVALYGGYWDRYGATRAQARGHVDAAGLRKATAGAKVCLGLVRRANRDGHSMRTFEVPAMGGCLLAEDTADHRQLFGPEGAAVLYFSTAEEAVDKGRRLVSDADLRRRLANAAHALVTGGGHTYADRLSTALGVAAATHHEDRHRRSGQVSRV